MSKVQLQGNASGTGIFTIASPNSNTDRTLTLPDNTGTVLTTASNLAGQTGVGKILQVVQASVSTSADYTTSTPTLRVSLSITPSSTSSRIYLIYTAGDCVNATGSSSTYGGSWFYRNSTQLIKFTAEVTRINSAIAFWSVIAGNYIDSPSSTSAITYAVYHANTNAGTFRVGDSNMPSILTAMEVAA